MVILVVLTNLLLSLLLIYLAWRVWLIKQMLTNLADKLTAYEQSTYTVLHTAPENIYLAQDNIYTLREKHQRLKLQILQIRQIINLLLLLQKIWQRNFLPIKSKSAK
ncbi:hypothetical protein VB711_07415 [Cronbergia sp. UHCC 0137]|uniref:hypothetical protein n=1 Tax=Cronbergia sp. UHCC 0137 TaxID=3110239 RepID=UPI002B1F7929|nr:hypothetical protein [Cronbergia sp. UHCC 0137]MEA5617664.1 hypothetical protein [Cronbergia sp. UHCC 0137]